jgi:flagella basal body P-ring formation protein FlgA
LASVCQIESYNVLARFEKFNQRIIKETNCSTEKIQQFLDIVNEQKTKKLNSETLYAQHSIYLINTEISIFTVDELLNEYAHEGHKINTLGIISFNKFLYSDTAIIFKANNLKHEPGKYNLEALTSHGNYFINYALLKERVVYVAKKDLPAHSKELTPQDFELKTVYTENSNLTFVTNKSEIEFMRLNRSLSIGDSLTTNVIYSPQLIKFGDIIQTQVENNGVKIEFNARALKGGKLNEIIQLENLNSKKSFAAQVVGNGKIKVLL